MKFVGISVKSSKMSTNPDFSLNYPTLTGVQNTDAFILTSLNVK